MRTTAAVSFCCLLTLAPPLLAQGEAYITGETTVRVLDLETEVVETSIPVVSTFGRVAFSSTQGEAWVTAHDGPATIIDTATQSVDGSVGPPAVGIAIHPDGSTAYIADSDDGTTNDSVIVFDVATRTEVTTITLVPDVAPATFGLAMSPDGERVYAVNQESDELHVIDTATNSEITSVPIGGFGPLRVTVSPDNSLVYVGGISEVSVVDASTFAVIDTYLPGATFIQALAVRGDGERLYVADNDAPGTLYVIDTSTGATVTTVAAGTGPSDVVVDDTRDIAYVTVNDGIVKIDTTTNANLGSILMTSPFKMAIRMTEIFADGFESGDTTAWSTTVP